MAGYVCTIAGGKGGVGKTTTAINVAGVLEERGHDTVVVDADLGMANLGAMLDLDQDESVHEILAGNATVSDTLCVAPGGMAVIPGEQRLEAFAEADPANLRTVIEELKERFDTVLIDTGSGLSHETTVPLGLADGILLVTTPDTVAINDTNKTADLAARVDGTVLGTVLTRGTHHTDVEERATQLEMSLIGVIPLALEAPGNEPLVRNAPDSDVAVAYRRLTTELERVFFEGAAGADLDRVLDEEWAIDRTDAGEDDGTDDEISNGSEDEKTNGESEKENGESEKTNRESEKTNGESEKGGIVSRVFGWL